MPHRIHSILLCLLCTAAFAYSQSQTPSLNRADKFFNDSLFKPALQEYQKFLITRAGGTKTYSSYQDSINQSNAGFKIAICLNKLNDNAKASDAFDDFIRTFPKDGRVVDARYYAAMAQKNLGNLKEASERFFQLYYRFPNSGLAQNALFSAAQCSMMSQDKDRAIELFSHYNESYGRDSKAQDAIFFLASLLFERKEYALAEQKLDEAQRLSVISKNNMPRLYYYKAIIAQELQKNEIAARNFSAMISCDEVFDEKERALAAYIAFARKQNDCRTGLLCYKKLSDNYQRKSQILTKEFLYSWAQCAEQCGEFSDEEKLYKRILLSFPQDSLVSKTSLALAQCQIKKHDLAAAFETLQALMTKDSVSDVAAEATYVIAELYNAQAVYENAINAYRRYCRMKSAQNIDKALFEIGKIYKEKLCRYDAAAQEFESLLRRFAESPLYHEALYAIAECEEMAGSIQVAVRRYYRVVESDAPQDLVDKARKRMSYLSAYRATNLENAVRLLADIAQKKADSSEMTVRLFRVAEIYENDLRDYDAAMQAYDRIDTYVKDPADSVQVKLLFQKARVFEKIHEKAKFENNVKTADSARTNALSLYKEVLKFQKQVAFADQAAYRIMLLSSPDISSFERFMAKYPKSEHKNEVLLNIARYYETKSSKSQADSISKKKALEAYRNILVSQPAGEISDQAYLGCGRVYCSLGKPDSALLIIAQFNEHCADSNRVAEGDFIEAKAEKQKQNYSVALDKFKKVLYSYPFNGFARQSRFEIAETFFAMSRYHDALSNYRLCALHTQLDAISAAARLGMGKSYAALGKLDEAASALSSLISEKLPAEFVATAKYELGMVLQKRGDFSGAMRLYSQIVSSANYPEKQSVYLKLGALEFEIRKYAEACGAYENALLFAKSEPESADAMSGVCVSLTMAGQQKAADKKTAFFIQRFGSEQSAFSEIVYYTGLHSLLVGDFDKARKYFLTIVNNYPKSSRKDGAAYQFALSYFYQGKEDKALELFNKFIEDYPQSDFIGLAQFKIGMIYHQQNDFEQSITFFSAVLSHPETDSTTRFRAAYNAAIGLQKLSRWLEAGKMYELMLDSFPEEMSISSAHLKIGFCLIQAMRPQEALVHFQKASDNPNTQDKPEILYWIATCYAKMGDYPRAASEYLKVPALYAGIGRWDLTSECEAARIYERLGDYPKAVSLYKKIISTDGETGNLGKEAVSRVEQLNVIMESQ